MLIKKASPLNKHTVRISNCACIDVLYLDKIQAYVQNNYYCLIKPWKTVWQVNVFYVLGFGNFSLFTVSRNKQSLEQYGTDAVCYDKEKTYSTGAIVMM